MKSGNTSALDALITGIDSTLRQVAGVNQAAGRPVPGADINDPDELSREQAVLAGRLMRINHSGEVAAQALYRGQALATTNEAVRSTMQEAADEETDHLIWCQHRLDELNARPSVLNPLWYAGSFALGYIAGKAGDDWSLGFVGETERQVEQHLDHHLDRLPQEDRRSRAIIEVMKEDEARHGQTAMDAGGRELPGWAQKLMRLTSKVMTRGAYWL